MRRPDGGDGALGAVASAALGLGLGIAVLVGGLLVSQASLSGGAVAVTATKTPLPTPSPSPTPLPTLPPPTPPPTPAPTPTAAPLIVSSYQGQGLQLVALSAPVGYTYRAPITGTIHIETYQFVNGEIRQDAGGPGILSYPYVYIRAADQEVKLRPGALDQDVQLLVREGQIVAAGEPLFKTVGPGPSSWRTFYDSFVTAQVIVSARKLPSGEGFDPVPLFQK